MSGKERSYRATRQSERRKTRTIERPLVGDIIHEQNAHRTAVIRGGDGSKPFLPRSVPLRDGTEDEWSRARATSSYVRFGA